MRLANGVQKHPVVSPCRADDAQVRTASVGKRYRQRTLLTESRERRLPTPAALYGGGLAELNGLELNGHTLSLCFETRGEGFYRQH